MTIYSVCSTVKSLAMAPVKGLRCLSSFAQRTIGLQKTDAPSLAGRADLEPQETALPVTALAVPQIQRSSSSLSFHSCESASSSSSRLSAPMQIRDVALTNPLNPVESNVEDSRKHHPSNAKELTDLAVKNFSENASRLTTIYFFEPSIPYKERLEILSKAQKSPDTPLIDVFFAHKAGKISIFGKMKAYFWYFIGYQSGLFPNFIQTFANSVIGKLRAGAAEKDGSSLRKFILTFLERADSFLGTYQKGLNAFANCEPTFDKDGKEVGGGRKEIMAETLKKLQGKESLSEICRCFTGVLVDEFLPPVSLFAGWKEHKSLPIRWLGYVLIPPIQALINRIARKQLSESQLIESMVTSSIEATDSSNTAFDVAIKKGIVGQLEKLKEELDHPSASPLAADKDQLMDFPDLSRVVQTLIQVLKLESYQERTALKLKLQEHPSLASAPYQTALAELVSPSISASAIEGCRALFTYLANPKNSEDCFYNLFSLANSAFEPGSSDEFYQTESQNLQAKMEKIAKEIFTKFIRQSVHERLQGPDDAKTETIAAQLTLDLQDSFETSFNELEQKFQEIERRKLTCEEAIGEFKNALREIRSACEQKNQMLLNLPEENVPTPLKASIEKTYANALETLDFLLQAASDTEQLQAVLTKTRSMQKELLEIRSQLDLIASQPSFTDISKALAKAKQAQLDLLKTSGEEAEKLTAPLEILQQLHDARISDARTESILNQLLHLHASLSAPVDKPAKMVLDEKLDTLRKIKFQCNSLYDMKEASNASFPIEKETLSRCISAIEQSLIKRESIATPLGELKGSLDDLSAFHAAQQKQTSERFESARSNLAQTLRDRTVLELDPTIDIWENQLDLYCDYIKSELDQLRVLSEIAAIEKDKAHLKRALQRAGGWRTQILWGSAAALAATTFGGIAGAASLGAYLLGGISGASLVAIPAATAGLAGSTTFALGNAAFYSGKIPSALSDNHVLPEVRSIFDNLYGFLRQPSVWESLVTQSLLSINHAYRKKP